jgi:uncharacterized protein (DUF58 family)
MSLLDPETLELLHRHRVPIRAGARGHFAGQHRAREAGEGLEFVEYRDYQPGDPTRFIDWKVLGRMDRAYVRRHAHESAVRVHLYLDCSASMGGGAAAHGKLRFAAAFLAHLAFVFLRQGDEVRVTLAGDDGPLPSAVARGTGALRDLDRLLRNARARGGTSFTPLLDELARARPRPDLVVLASDLMCAPGRLEELLRLSGRRGPEVRLVHVLSPEEIAFPFERFARFEDPESPEQPLELQPRAIRARYLDALARFLARIETSAAERGVRYARVPSDTPLREAVLHYLMEGAPWA